MITSIKMIYKASIALHFTPTKWKSSKVVFIPKVGKDDYALMIDVSRVRCDLEMFNIFLALFLSGSL